MWWTDMKYFMEGKACLEYIANFVPPLKNDLFMFYNLVCSFSFNRANFALGLLSSATVDPRHFRGFIKTELMVLCFLIHW